MKKNLIQQKLKNGEIVIGSHISFDDPAVTELLGDAGYDFLWIDQEHTALDRLSLQNHLIATRATGTSSLIRAPWNDPIIVKPILELGPDGIIFPMVNTADEAEKAISSTLYPPAGIRGFGPRRAIRYGLDNANQYVNENQSGMLRIIQIESITAVENLDEILEVKDIDAFIIGPCDLSLSLGNFAAFKQDSFLQAIDKIISKVKKDGRPLGISMGTYSKEELKFWVDKGITILSIGGDVSYLKDGALEGISNFREITNE